MWNYMATIHTLRPLPQATIQRLVVFRQTFIIQLCLDFLLSCTALDEQTPQRLFNLARRVGARRSAGKRLERAFE